MAPLGVCLGAFMPLGLATVAATTDYKTEYVAWAWAVNGFFSVVSSVLATILSMTFGFDRVMLAGVAVYAVGIVALLRVPVPAAAPRRAVDGRAVSEPVARLVS
jgi:MFS family permease